MMERTDTMKKQIGGDHYTKHMGMQVWDIVDEYKLNYYEASALKYLLRGKGDRVEDLQKLIHYAEKEIENIVDADIVSSLTDADVAPEMLFDDMVKDTIAEMTRSVGVDQANIDKVYGFGDNPIFITTLPNGETIINCNGNDSKTVFEILSKGTKIDLSKL